MKGGRGHSTMEMDSKGSGPLRTPIDFPMKAASPQSLELSFARLLDAFIALKFFSHYECQHMLVPIAPVFWFCPIMTFQV